MQERKISESEIKECLANWYSQRTDKKGNPIYKAKLRSGRGIKTVVAKEDLDLVITVADF